MVSAINITIFVLWAFDALFDYLHYCYIWQLKEYRTDRMRDFLTTQQGKSYFYNYPFLLRALLALVTAFWPFNTIVIIKYILIALFTADLLYHCVELLQKQQRRPIFTPKALGIIGLSLFVEGGIFILLRDWSFLFLLLVMRFPLISILVALVQYPTFWLKQYFISQATKKIQTYSGLTVIGITGSYGKSSVKEFTAHILSQKYKVIKTPKNINSEIGVAKFILSNDFTDTDVFVCEMGAYKIGEIQLICNMVKPKIGILTTIAGQHLSLFGSIENIQKAKYELLSSIPEDGVVITNADNKYCTEFLNQLKCKHIETFGYDEENHPTCRTTDVKANLNGTEFEGIYQGIRGRIKTPVIGAHHATNIAAAVMVAIHLGLSREEIIRGCETLPRDTHGLLKIINYGKATVIDDSYNSNPAGFKAALDVLCSFASDKKRIVITRGMLELGNESDELHEMIGGEIAFVADELVVITPDFIEPLKRGVGQKYHTSVSAIYDPQELVRYIQSKKNENVVILLENRMPAIVISELGIKTL